MRLLVIGGTRFVGRHIVDAALARGHEVTLFNRGNDPDVFPGVEHIEGDRDSDLSALRGRSWDTVIDTCGYSPRQVESAAEVLRDSVNRYVFISTISVYADPVPLLADEDAPLAHVDDPTNEDLGEGRYGGLKVWCERALSERMGARLLVIRPGLVAGPHDRTDRFTYWVLRVARGGEVLAPRGPDLPVQWIDARDLAAWTMDLVERGGTGTYNATAEPGRFTMGALLDACREATGSGARITWVDEELLISRGLEEYQSLPLWVTGDNAGFAQISNARAVAAGLSIRPAEDTVRDTWEWAREARAGEELKAGISPEQEAELLDLWRKGAISVEGAP